MDTRTDESRVAKRLVEYFGGKPAVEKALKVSRETVRLWLRDGIPLENAIWIEEKTDGFVTAEEILKEAKRAA